MKRSLLVLSLLSFAAVSFAEIAGERPVSTIVYGPAPGQRYGTAAASDGRDFLVAWVDTQRNRGNIAQLYATRMNAAGDVLDPLSIRIPTISHEAYRVDVVFLGDAYLVYWSEPSPISRGFNALMGVRISSDGVVLDSVPRLLADRAEVNVRGAASNGNRTVIAYSTSSGSRMLVVDRNANVVDGPKAFVQDSGVRSAIVASNGREFFVAWKSDRVYATRIDADGVPATSQPIILSSHTELYDLASDGDSYVAIVSDRDAGVVAQHVSAAGELLERSAIPLQQVYPAFAFAGGSYLLMDGNALQNTIFVRQLDRTGKPVGASAPLASGTSYGAGGSLASNGSDAAAFWTAWNATPQAFDARIIDGRTLALSNTTAITRSANAQTTPDAATSGRNMAIVWNESNGTYAGRLTLDGQLLDGRGIRIGNPSIAAPRIVFDGANYIAGWIEQSAAAPAATVKVARLSPDSGLILGAGGMAVASNPCGNGLALSAGAEATLVAWSDCQRVVANTIAHDGSLGVATTVTPADTTRTGSVTAAWNGREWLVAWEDLVMSGGIFIDIPFYDTFLKAARISSSFALLDPKPITVGETRNDFKPLLASGGNDFLIAWTRYTGTPTYSVIAQRISSDGSLLAGGRLGTGRAKSVVWDGQQYAVAFASSPFFTASTLYVTHVAASGEIESSSPQSVVSNIVDPDAALIMMEPGRVIAAYSRVASGSPYGDVERLFLGAPHAIRGRAVRTEVR
jgi:hypothetical protein